MLGLKKRKKVIKKVSKLQVNIINSSTSTEGIISCETSIRFDGKLQGEINAANKIVIGEKAIINGTLIADIIEVFGTVKGDCHAKITVTLSSSAKYSGNIFTNQIIILEGAVFNGSIEMPLKINEVQVENKNPQINYQRKKMPQKIALYVYCTFLLLIELVFQIGGVPSLNQVTYDKNEVANRKAKFESEFHHLTSNNLRGNKELLNFNFTNNDT